MTIVPTTRYLAINDKNNEHFFLNEEKLNKCMKTSYRRICKVMEKITRKSNCENALKLDPESYQCQLKIEQDTYYGGADQEKERNEYLMPNVRQTAASTIWAEKTAGQVNIMGGMMKPLNPTIRCKFNGPGQAERVYATPRSPPTAASAISLHTIVESCDAETEI
ncbi:hypothetical protein TSAR_011481 [Trichomalopsis sarcophagae]|uniref:Uncharacterized protein n=1 Tax=Trichomalopsis sarcophagae TaxID=543379 RepID=A0A232ENK0_9HYME|nr:hypothetical protein TSAR_011481 [Trichomalopsis sarcophagae]